MANNNFIISIAGNVVDITIINMEEMAQYNEVRKRIASVVTEKKSYNELPKMNYQLAFNYSKPKSMVINSKNKPYVNVFEHLLYKYTDGLLIVETDTLSEAISDLLCKSNSVSNNDIDIMICRNSLGEMTIDECKKANYLRISADPSFEPSMLQKLQSFYQERILTIMICQLFVNEQYNAVKAYVDQKNNEYSKAGYNDFIDYYELNKQLAYFLYFDAVNNKVLNISRENLRAFALKLQKEKILPVTEDILNQLINAITFE